MKYLILLIPLALASCTKSAPDGVSLNPTSGSKGKPVTPTQLMKMDPMIVNVFPTSISTSESEQISLAAPRRGTAFKAIAVVNRASGEQTVSINYNSLDPAIMHEDNCQATLKAKRSCVIYLYFNQNRSYPSNTVIPSSSFLISNGESQKEISVTASITGETEDEEMQSAISFNKASIEFTTGYKAGSLRSDILVLRNNSSNPIAIPVSLGSLPSGWSVENNCPIPAEMLKPNRICALVISHNSNFSTAGEHNHSISVAGSNFQLKAIVEDFPNFEFNPNFELTGLPSGFSFTMNESSIRSYDIRVLNLLDVNKYASDIIYSKDLNLGDVSSHPSSLTTASNCGENVGDNRYCNFKFTFDPSLFPYQVSLSKLVYFGGEEYEMTLEGNSPCHPNHPQARPDARLGYKLNAQKTACIPQVGVFDSPDSYFGHAVFE